MRQFGFSAIFISLREHAEWGLRTPKHSLVDIGRAVVAHVQDPSGSKGPDARELCFAFSTPGFGRAGPNELELGQ